MSFDNSYYTVLYHHLMCVCVCMSAHTLQGTFGYSNIAPQLVKLCGDHDFDIVMDIPTHPMHTLFLGIAKKIFSSLWFMTTPHVSSFHTNFYPKCVTALQGREVPVGVLSLAKQHEADMLLCSIHVPHDFGQPRWSVESSSHWKGTLVIVCILVYIFHRTCVHYNRALCVSSSSLFISLAHSGRVDELDTSLQPSSAS